MTEQEWLKTDDWQRMIAFVDGRTTLKQRRLYLTAGLRELWPLLYAERSRSAVDVVERHAFGLATDEELGLARYSAESVTFGYDFDIFADRIIPADAQRLLELGRMSVTGHSSLPSLQHTSREDLVARLLNVANLAECGAKVWLNQWDRWLWPCLQKEPDWPGSWLVREVFGNPFRVNTFDSNWRTETVQALCRGIVAERAFDRLPILADALEEAGCDDVALFTHLRGSHQHVLGCWALDRLTHPPMP
jgi:hypothetical protein